MHSVSDQQSAVSLKHDLDPSVLNQVVSIVSRNKTVIIDVADEKILNSQCLFGKHQRNS